MSKFGSATTNNFCLQRILIYPKFMSHQPPLVECHGSHFFINANMYSPRSRGFIRQKFLIPGLVFLFIRFASEKIFEFYYFPNNSIFIIPIQVICNWSRAKAIIMNNSYLLLFSSILMKNTWIYVKVSWVMKNAKERVKG